MLLKDLKDAVRSLPPVTAILILLNILVFVLCTFTGSLLYNKGVLGLMFLTYPGALYRLITSMFLHADITHIFSNMVLLLFLGQLMEKEMGHVLFLVCYFISGIGGGLTYMVYEYSTGRNSYVLGASGAVFGLLGALLAFVLFKRITGRTMRPIRVIFVLIMAVYEGFMDPEVAGFAHLGGLLFGFLISLVYCLVSKEENHFKGKENED